jgi:hypothetical protein
VKQELKQQLAVEPPTDGCVDNTVTDNMDKVINMNYGKNLSKQELE